ncbi:hypothetical protein NDU88_002220 [Pleurodeles waltl]|uniref:Uncharacterized protein n=1 Tax=Pleurodeles waltl TaxID=8319 RepID=A0AAV7RD57_PLEWA|nr:hypothetical protein NDU88_002220 [Pleurodeles waltl]
MSRRLRPCRADPHWPRETRLRPPARPLLLRCVAVFLAIFYEPPLQGSELGVFRKPPELVVSHLRRLQAPAASLSPLRRRAPRLGGYLSSWPDYALIS